MEPQVGGPGAYYQAISTGYELGAPVTEIKEGMEIYRDLLSRRVMDRNGTLPWMSLSANDKYRIYRPLRDGAGCDQGDFAPGGSVL